MQGTIRTYSVPLSEFIYERICKLAKSLSEEKTELMKKIEELEETERGSGGFGSTGR